jgi:hypothetical protein
MSHFYVILMDCALQIPAFQILQTFAYQESWTALARKRMKFMCECFIEE